jgi:hypothetical protein
LAPARSSLDQPTVSRNRTRTSYVDDGCLNSSRGVIFPGSHRLFPGRPSVPAIVADSSSPAPTPISAQRAPYPSNSHGSCVAIPLYSSSQPDLCPPAIPGFQ